MADTPKPSAMYEISSGQCIGLVYHYLDKLRGYTKDSTMPIQQVITLLALYTNGTIAVADLHKYTNVKGSSNSRNLAKLGEGERPLIKPGPGWVRTWDDLNDRRFKYASLTPQGRALLEAVTKEVLKS